MAVVVAAVIAVAVASDLSVPATAAGRRADLTAYTATIESYVGACSAGVHDAVAAYGDMTSGRLARSIVSDFIQQGIAACSFTNTGIVDLGGLQPPRSLALLHLGRLAPSVDSWAYLDGFTALQDLRVVLSTPGSAGARSAFDHEVAALDGQRQSIENLVSGARQSLGMGIRPLGLSQIEPLA